MSAAQLVWGALLAGQAAMLVVAASLERGPAEAPGAVPVALGLVAAFQAVLADLLHRQTVAVRGGRSPGPAGAVRGAWLLDEAIGAYGLVLALLGFSGATWAGFSVVGTVLLVLHRPALREGPPGPGSG